MSTEEVPAEEKNRQVVLRGSSFFGKIKQVDTKRYEYLASMISFSDELTISNVSELIKEISFYEYGPMLTIWELDDFIKKIVQKQPLLAKFRKELFYFLYNIVIEKKSVDTSILVFKYPYCFMLKFGCLEDIKHIIHFDNNSYYNIESKSSIQYEESFYNEAFSIWSVLIKERRNNVKSILGFTGQKVREETVKNTASLIAETSALESSISQHLIDQMEHLKALQKKAQETKLLIDARDNLMASMQASAEDSTNETKRGPAPKTW